MSQTYEPALGIETDNHGIFGGRGLGTAPVASQEEDLLPDRRPLCPATCYPPFIVAAP